MNITRIPANYFPLESRSFVGVFPGKFEDTDNVADSSEYLRKHVQPWYTDGVPQSKGGQVVTDGRFSNSKGGRKEASVYRRDREAHVTEGDAPRPQNRQGMAHLSQRTDAVSSGETSRQKSEQGRRINVLSVAEPAPTVLQALSASSCLRYLIVILPYDKAKGKG